VDGIVNIWIWMHHEMGSHGISRIPWDPIPCMGAGNNEIINNTRVKKKTP
jgi:hypothetical protein